MLPSPETQQLVLDACRQGAELDVVLAPVEREVVLEVGDDAEYEEYDEEAGIWTRKFHWGSIRVRPGTGMGMICTCMYIYICTAGPRLVAAVQQQLACPPVVPLQASKWHALEGGAPPFSAALFAAPDEVAQSAEWVNTHWPAQQASGTAPPRHAGSRGGYIQLRLVSRHSSLPSVHVPRSHTCSLAHLLALPHVHCRVPRSGQVSGG